MRLTIRTLTKILIVILLVVFIGPHVISFFERPSGDDHFEEHRRAHKHDLSDHNDGHVKAKAVLAKPVSNVSLK